jgi:RNA polymerase sigma factor (sigma-70 family)
MKVLISRYADAPSIGQAEVERLLPLFRAGDERAGQIIVEGNMRFVVYVVSTQFVWAWNHQGAALSAEDLFQEGAIGLCRALSSYDPNRGRFITHAWYWVRHSIQSAVKNTVSRGNEETSLEKFEGVESSHWRDEPFLIEAFTDPQNIAVEVEDHEQKELLRQRIAQALEQLSPRDAHILRWRFGIGCSPATLQQIATSLGVSRERVHKIEKDARVRLGKTLVVHSDNSKT